MVAPLVDPIGDGHCFFGHLEPLAESPGQALQLGPGQGPQAAVEVLDGLGIEGRLTNSLVVFTDLKFPTTNAGNAYGGTNAAYSPVLTMGAGFKF